MIILRHEDKEQIGDEYDEMNEPRQHRCSARPKAHDADGKREEEKHGIPRTQTKSEASPGEQAHRTDCRDCQADCGAGGAEGDIQPSLKLVIERCPEPRAPASGISTSAATKKPTIASAWVT